MLNNNYSSVDRLMFSYMRTNILDSINNIMLGEHSRFTFKSDTIEAYGDTDGEWIHTGYADLNSKHNEFITVNIGFDDDHKMFCEFNKYTELNNESKLIKEGYSIDDWEYFVIECLNTANHFSQL